MMMKSNNRGLTLIEILIVVSLMAVITLALYHAFLNGVKVWQRSQRVAMEENIAIFFDKFTHDIHNAMFYSLFEYKGDKNRISFPAVILRLPDKNRTNFGNEYHDEIGKIEYFFNRGERKLYKKTANYSQAVNNRYGANSVFLSSVDDVRFKYIYITNKEEVESDEILELFPSTVRVEVQFTDSFGKRNMTKSVDVPIGI